MLPPPPPPPMAAPTIVTPKVESGVNIAVELKGATKVVLLKVCKSLKKLINFIIRFSEYGWTW